MIALLVQKLGPIGRYFFGLSGFWPVQCSGGAPSGSVLFGTLCGSIVQLRILQQGIGVTYKVYSLCYDVQLFSEVSHDGFSLDLGLYGVAPHYRDLMTLQFQNLFDKQISNRNN